MGDKWTMVTYRSDSLLKWCEIDTEQDDELLLRADTVYLDTIEYEDATIWQLTLPSAFNHYTHSLKFHHPSKVYL